MDVGCFMLVLLLAFDLGEDDHIPTSVGYWMAQLCAVAPIDEEFLVGDL